MKTSVITLLAASLLFAGDAFASKVGVADDAAQAVLKGAQKLKGKDAIKFNKQKRSTRGRVLQRANSRKNLQNKQAVRGTDVKQDTSSLRVEDTRTEKLKEDTLNVFEFKEGNTRLLALQSIQNGVEAAKAMGLKKPVWSVGYRNCLAKNGYTAKARENAIHVINAISSAAYSGAATIASVTAAGAEVLSNLTDKSFEKANCAIATISKALNLGGACEILNPVFEQPAQAVCVATN